MKLNYTYMEIERNSKLSSDIFNEIELKRWKFDHMDEIWQTMVKLTLG
jgi:hypothetical protein